ncbi:MAG: TFIIB-type zinc finger domain-containing protein [Litoreibacter sp.]|nr:TFIIB-type zinc finger domain-containing protein [Litoreibacter sp.]
MNASAPAQEYRFPCDNCGSDLEFDPASGLLKCGHCGNTETVVEGRASSIEELDFDAALRGRLAEAEMEETRVTQCPNCAAQVQFDADIHATECPFCATPVVADTGTHRHIKPRGTLPFALDERQARKAMTEWLGSLWFAPNGLKDYARKGRKLDGIYVPYWTYDAATRTRYTGQRGIDYQERRTVMRDGKKKTIMVTKTRWNSVSGRVARDFDDVLVLGSTSLPKKYTDALQPWDLTHLRPYSPEYLAGFRAEAYTVELDQGFTEARQIMDRRITRDIRFDIGGDRQRIHSADTQVSDVTFKHVLLPVWMAAYKYRGRTFRFVVNGQTGAVRGERPFSAIKIAIAVVLGLILAAAIGYGMALQQ